MGSGLRPAKRLLTCLSPCCCCPKPNHSRSRHRRSWRSRRRSGARPRTDRVGVWQPRGAPRGPHRPSRPACASAVVEPRPVPPRAPPAPSASNRARHSAALPEHRARPPARGSAPAHIAGRNSGWRRVRRGQASRREAPQRGEQARQGAAAPGVQAEHNQETKLNVTMSEVVTRLY